MSMDRSVHLSSVRIEIALTFWDYKYVVSQGMLKKANICLHGVNVISELILMIVYLIITKEVGFL
jgi:hypothetical protein